MEKVLTDDQINNLRRSGTLSSNEIAIKIGDLIIAENVITRERRVVSEAQSLLNETGKRILKG